MVDGERSQAPPERGYTFRVVHSERLHALDAVRAFALLLGVALHGGNAYVAGFPWTISDDPSPLIAAAVYVIHIFRMTLFFLIAGFFAHLAFHRKGRSAFVRDRLWRVALPLAAGWFVLMPAMAGAAVLAAAVTGAGFPVARPAGPAGEGTGIAGAIVSGFPWAHLWFLYYLLGLYALALSGRAIVKRVDHGHALERAADRAATWLVRGYVAPLVLGAPILALYLTDSTPAGWFNIPSPITGLVPEPVSWTAYTVAFLFGWILHRQTDLIRVWERRWVPNAIVAVVSTAVCLALGGSSRMAIGPDAGYLATAVHAVVYVVAIWTWIFAIIGASLTYLSAYRAGIRYLADASYWIYLVHVPIVMLIQVGLWLVGWLPLLKCVIVVTVTTAVCLATYQIMVRHTVIGLVLNGRRGGSAAPEQGRAPEPAGAAAT